MFQITSIPSYSSFLPLYSAMFCSFCKSLVDFFLFILVAVSVPEPIAYYPLDKIHGTSEINNRQPEGTPFGVALASGPDGQEGGSYQFAEESRIEFPNDGGLDVQRSITISLWMYVEAHFNKDAALVSYSYPEIHNVGIALLYSGGYVGFFYYNPSKGNFVATVTSKPLAQDVATWRHFAASYDYDTGYSRLWVDGKMVAERQDDAGVDLITNNPITLGTESLTPNARAFQGRMTQLKIFDVALTDEQINKIFVVGEGDEGSVYVLKPLS